MKRQTTKPAPAHLAEGPGIPCFLCHANLIPRLTYKEKPYLICDACGIQIFIRGLKGRELFSELMKGLERDAT